MLTVNSFIKTLSFLLIISISVPGFRITDNDCICKQKYGKCKNHCTSRIFGIESKCSHGKHHSSAKHKSGACLKRKCGCNKLNDISCYWNLYHSLKDHSNEQESEYYILGNETANNYLCLPNKESSLKNNEWNPYHENFLFFIKVLLN